MPAIPRTGRAPAAALAAASVLALALSLSLAPRPARGDTVVLKNGVVYRGTVDRDKPLMWVYDGLRRVVLRDSKVARVDSDASFRNLERFRIEQPLVVHGGSMPREVLSVKAGPWNDRGRRTFAFEGPRPGRFVRMEQAINEMDPHMVKVRGVDGYWQGQLATTEVPREVVLGILGKVERGDKNERVRVARFLIQAGWYAEALDELDHILKDFADDADLRDNLTAARASLGQLDAVRVKADVDRCRAARQPREAAALLRTFPTDDVPSDLEASVRAMQRADKAQAEADRALGKDLKDLYGRLYPAPKESGSAPLSRQKVERKKAERPKDEWEDRVEEVLKALAEAPDAVRDRLVAWQKAKAEGGKEDKALLALAMSGYVVGADAAVSELKAAGALWAMRDDVAAYLRSAEGSEREAILGRLESAGPPAGADGTRPAAVAKLDIVTRLARLMPPPLHDDSARPGVKTYRVRDDTNEVPTEYAVSLPPEYHPLRSYPAILALHDGRGPESAVGWWAAEAARRGYIVIAPEYAVPDRGTQYHYSESEHAAGELALRDAKRRFSVDDDRVFVGGQLTGSQMAGDLGLTHPDLFAGVVMVSGFPEKYVFRTLPKSKTMPLYVVLGDLYPASSEVVFGQVLKPLITEAWDVTYVEYFRRGVEPLPEEAPAVFDWMDRRRRDPYPKSFEAVAARACDARWHGLVVREFLPGRTTAPEAVDPGDKNLTPATIKMESSKLSNNLRFTTSGVKSVDVWVSPKLIDFTKRMEVRINGRSQKGQARPDLSAFLEDLRVRGDRQQVYWMKVPAG